MRKEFLEKLIETPSPSGDEIKIQKLWIDQMKEHADEIRTDFAGNAIAVLNPEADFKVLLAGHCDEIAFMVTHIDDKGFLSVTKAGGINPKLALGTRVRVYGKEVIKGVVGVKAEHKGGAKGEVKPEDLIIDLGACSKDELKDLVSVGDYVLYDVDYEYLLNENFAGRGLDNRTGSFIVGEVLRELKDQDINVGVYAVSTVNEETNMGGAYFAAAGIKPNMALACDVTFATDAPGANPKAEGNVKLGGGPVLAKGSMINFKINNLLKEAAEKADIDLQWELTPRTTGTDADKMRFTGEGVPVGLVSLPLRYMHSPSEVVSLKDIESEIKLLVEMIKSLSGNENLKPLE
ncbi:M42 family metallopeptidase [Acidaminobacter sp. JC074]|uniref:M20/M25/M40 family metallo-hydrolase n=1 Tax=Acidaminobacter sp. JC074 TaxID=2530199 RepID=UPI001F0E2A79|nr:M20/M25/M40 family metallo-hydrolase [Acidaminobacter sp. JC074]MCH4889643.1 M42 family metallopeptidase [Acidaminobacter sp. JC074]